jgi:uncharacterized protein with PIN domain
MDKPLKFLVDDTLRGLTKKLRMIGYDTIERGGASWWVTLGTAKQEGRVVVTLHNTLRAPPGVLVWVLQEENTNLQVQEILNKIPPNAVSPQPFSLCLVCNHPIDHMDPENARPLVPPMVAKQQSCFFQCPICQRIYWRGSHYRKMIEWMNRWEVPQKLGLSPDDMESPNNIKD